MRHRLLTLLSAALLLAGVLILPVPQGAGASPAGGPGATSAASAPVPAYPAQILATSLDNRLVSWRSDAPAAMTDLGPITLNDPDAQTVIGMAVRPRTGQLYVLLNNGRLGSLNAASRQVTPLGSFPLAVDLPGQQASMAFDPVTDVLRIINADGFNYRVDPETLAVTQVGRAVWNCSFGSLANTNPNPGATTSTTLATDLCSGLLRIGGRNGVAPPPDSGAVRQVATIGFAPDRPVSLFTSTLAIPPGPDGSRLGYVLAGWIEPGQFFEVFGIVDLATGAVSWQRYQLPPTVQGSLGPMVVLPIGVLQMATDALTVSRTAGSVSTDVLRTAGAWAAAGATVRTVDGTARSGIDYVALSQPLFFDQGVTSLLVTVQILEPAVRSGGRYFDLELTSPTGGTVIGPPTRTRITIQDDGPAVVAMAKPALTVRETDGSAPLRVIRTGNTTREATVRFQTADGTAIAGLDYNPVDLTLQFASGEAEKTVTVPLLINPAAGTERDFTATLSAPGPGVQLGTPVTTTVTIIDDLAPARVNFATGGVAVQDTAGFVTLQVTRSGTLAAPTTVSFATANGTAQAGTNYTARSGTLAFAPGQSQATITVPILRDPNQAGPLAFTVSLSGPVGGTLGSPATATVTILNTGEPSVVRMATASGSTPQGPRTIQVPVIRIGNVQQQASVKFNLRPGTAVPGTDYLPGPGIVVFQPGQARTTIPVSVLGDPAATTVRDFFVDLGEVTGGTLATPATTRVSIVPGAGAPPAVQFEGSETRVSEAAASVTVQVSRIGNTAGVSTVDFRTENRTAEAGVDYQATSGTLTFGPGVASQPVTVQILNAPEPQDVRFAIVLGNPGGAVLGAPDLAIVAIYPETTFLPQLFRSWAGGW